MNSSAFLCGVVSAWALTQVVIGGFFSVAFVIRREVEYLLFGLFCFALAGLSGGIATMHGAIDLPVWRVGASVAASAVIVTAALNLHFMMRFARLQAERYLAPAAYSVSAVFLIFHALGLWRVRGTEEIHESVVLGVAMRHVSVHHYFAADLYYVVALGITLGCILMMIREVKRGRPGAMAVVVGGSVIGVAALNDLGLIFAWWTHGIYLIPHAFLFYSFAVGISLLLRQRDTVGRLEVTAKSLRERTEELRRSYQDLRVMEDELGRREQLAAVGELAATIAHEVRNPLAVISNAAAGLRRPRLRDDDRRTLLEIVDEEVARLNRLVTDLLRFARPVSISWSSVDLRELAERVRAMAPEGVIVVVDIEDDPRVRTVSVDAGLLRLVLENLVENACQAMPEGGTLSIAVRTTELDGEPATCLEVRDTGRGMDERTRERALKPFFTTRPQGTGLGLPIVDRIVRAHGGAVELRSELGQGTGVCLIIPFDEAVRRRRRSEAYATNATTTGG